MLEMWRGLYLLDLGPQRYDNGRHIALLLKQPCTGCIHSQNANLLSIERLSILSEMAKHSQLQIIEASNRGTSSRQHDAELREVAHAFFVQPPKRELAGDLNGCRKQFAYVFDGSLIEDHFAPKGRERVIAGADAFLADGDHGPQHVAELFSGLIRQEFPLLPGLYLGNRKGPSNRCDRPDGLDPRGPVGLAKVVGPAEQNEIGQCTSRQQQYDHNRVVHPS